MQLVPDPRRTSRTRKHKSRMRVARRGCPLLVFATWSSHPPVVFVLSAIEVGTRRPIFKGLAKPPRHFAMRESLVGPSRHSLQCSIIPALGGTAAMEGSATSCEPGPLSILRFWTKPFAPGTEKTERRKH
jgi:hypothetical protein